MTIGNMLRDRQQQYVATKDNTGTWRILDTWHDDITNLDPEAEISDASQAVTVLSKGAFIALVREATRLGVLQNAAMMENEALADQIEDLKEENEKLKIEVPNTPINNIVENVGLKEKAINAIVKLAAIDDLKEVTKE